MKKGKWLRLGMGCCLLVSIFFLPGSSPSHGDPIGECALCWLENMGGLGYLEVHNNTIYNILIVVRSGKENIGPLKITGNPSYMRMGLGNGTYQLMIYVCTPTPDQEPVYYRTVSVSVPAEYQTVVYNVTVPNSYIPIPKAK